MTNCHAVLEIQGLGGGAIRLLVLAGAPPPTRVAPTSLQNVLGRRIKGVFFERGMTGVWALDAPWIHQRGHRVGDACRHAPEVED